MKRASIRGTSHGVINSAAAVLARVDAAGVAVPGPADSPVEGDGLDGDSLWAGEKMGVSR